MHVQARVLDQALTRPSFGRPALPCSRQRKNAYMKSLEMENRALKLENERLR